MATIFSYIQEKEKNKQFILWDLYLHDLLNHKFFLNPVHKTCSEEIEILKLKLNSSIETEVVERFFKLHAQLAVDRIKLSQALPTLRRIHTLSSSCGERPNPDESEVVMLFNYLNYCVCIEASEEKLSSWYDVFIEIVSIMKVILAA